eukprot:8013931-Heterocapsa_arctica.AAC.1
MVAARAAWAPEARLRGSWRAGDSPVVCPADALAAAAAAALSEAALAGGYGCSAPGWAGLPGCPMGCACVGVA